MQKKNIKKIKTENEEKLDKNNFFFYFKKIFYFVW